jgi:hypothetical protein
MSIEQCANTNCSHFFELIEFGGDRPAPLVTRAVCCPYCGHRTERPTRGAFITAPSDQQLDGIVIASSTGTTGLSSSG